MSIYSPSSNPFRFAQSFFLDPARVGNSDRAIITSVSLYFKSLPPAGSNSSLIYDPGVFVAICPVENNVPVLSEYNQVSTGFRRASSIRASATALLETKFRLTEPLTILTGRKYAILIAFDGGESFVLWTARAGEVNLVTGQQVTIDSGYVDGQFFQITNGVQLDPLTSVDLSFKLNVARASNLNQTYELVNDNYEFLRVRNSSLSGQFFGGEPVYLQTSAAAGTVDLRVFSKRIVGTGTSFASLFSVNDRIVIESGPSKVILTVENIIDNTTLIVSEPVPFTNNAATYKKTVTGVVHNYDGINDLLILRNSTAANTTFKFNGVGSTTNTVVGMDSGATVQVKVVEDYPIMLYGVNHAITTMGTTTVNQTINFANSTYNVDPARTVNVQNGRKELISNYPAVIASKSNEVVNATNLHAPGTKSVIEKLTFTTTNPYASPVIRLRNLSFYVGEPDINNSSAGEQFPTGGDARSKYVSKVFDLPVAQYAEDLRVFLNVYRPQDTSIEVYAKFHNPVDPDPVSSKYWTKLDLIATANSTVISDPTNKRDAVGLEYTVPAFHSGVVQTGTFSTSLSSAVVVGTSGAVNTGIVAGDVVRIYNALIPSNYFITGVVSSNTSSFTIAGDTPGSTVVSNSSLVSTSMIVEKLTSNKFSAFTDNQNNNILRYYTSSTVPVSTYRTFAIKIVMLSLQSFLVPAVYDMKAIALSA